MLKGYDTPFERLHVTDFSVFGYSFLILNCFSLCHVYFNCFRCSSFYESYNLLLTPHISALFVMFICLWYHVDLSNFQCSSYCESSNPVCSLYIFVFSILVIFIYVLMTVSFLITFSEKGVNFALSSSLVKKTDEADHPWCLSIHGRVSRHYTL